jgi:hypothetical protein
VRRLVLLLTLAALLAPAAVASGTPLLRAVTTKPLAVQGVRFRPSERVTVRVVASGSARVHVVRATAIGTFRTTFTAISLERCVPFAVVARGSKGSVATLRPSPFRDCAPL